jgi:hypothetical protein
VKFLDANLIPPKSDSFSSEDEARKYTNKLSETIAHIKEINEEFSPSNTSMFKTSDRPSPVNSLYFFKNLLINKKILEQSNGLIKVNNLGPAFKERFLEDSNLKNILGKDQIVELKNTLKQEKFSSYRNTYYYLNLEKSINELHKLKEKHQAYITQNNSQKNPESYLHLMEEIQTPMPFQIFSKSHPRSQFTKAQDAYLKLETDILNTLRNVPESHFTNSANEEENYELHQQRIINTLTTINKSELNLRLAFINLYLQASENRIKQETDSFEKEALLDKTVKFLDANLIPPKSDSFSSEDEARKYTNKLSETIAHIKEINEEFSPSNTSMFKTSDRASPVNSIYLFKSLLINKILEQSNGLITVNNLGPAFKERFLENFNLKNILGKDQIAELKNGILKSILEQEKFLSYRSDANRPENSQGYLSFISKMTSAKNPVFRSEVKFLII